MIYQWKTTNNTNVACRPSTYTKHSGNTCNTMGQLSTGVWPCFGHVLRCVCDCVVCDCCVLICLAILFGRVWAICSPLTVDPCVAIVDVWYLCVLISVSVVVIVLCYLMCYIMMCVFLLSYCFFVLCVVYRTYCSFVCARWEGRVAVTPTAARTDVKAGADQPSPDGSATSTTTTRTAPTTTATTTTEMTTATT